MSPTFPAERLKFFSDAVIAITITLLMLEIRLPDSPGELGDAALGRSLLAIWPLYLSYGLSFLVVARLWAGYHQKFCTIERGNSQLTLLNILFLMAVGLVPFATSILAENGGALATAIYAGVMTVCALLLVFCWLYAEAAGLTELTVAPLQRRGVLLPSLLVAAVFAISIPLAFIDADAAKYFWLLLAPASVARRFWRRHAVGVTES